MGTQMFIPVIYNGALLVLLVLVLDIFSGGRTKPRNHNRVIIGFVLGLVGIAVMLNPWKAVEGVVFDTRSILLSIAGLFFGFIPAVIAGFMTAAYRIYQGGSGAIMGVCVIIASITVGVGWRKRNRGSLENISLLELLSFGMVVHVLMFLCAFTLPSEIRTNIMSRIALPTLSVYPLITVAIGSLLIWSHKRSGINAAMRASEEKYRLLADNTIDTIWVMGLDGRFQYLNSAVYNLLGYTSDEMTGRGLWEICDEDNYSKVRREIDGMIAALPERKEALFEAVLLTRDKMKVPVENTCKVVLDKEGAASALQGVTRDITDRKRIESETERLRLAVEQTVEAVMITDTKGIIVYVNPAFEKTSGYTKEEALGQNVSFLESGQHSKEFFREMWETIRRGETWAGCFINRKKDGTLFTEEASISPVLDTDGEIIYYIAAKRDVTYEHELEQQLRQSQKMEAVGQLAGGIAHDFNNILQAMMGYCEMLEESAGEDSEQNDFIQELANCTEKAAQLTRQLLTFSRREVIQPRNVDLNEIVRGVLKLIARTIGEHIQLHSRIYEGPILVHADPGNIEQVLMNLCVNARDAMPDGGKLIIETDRIFFDRAYCQAHGCEEEGYYGMMQIRDTGCGMDEMVQNQIFEPFFTTKEIGRGTGLGLATAYGIVKRHGGNIKVSSEKGKGSVFSVYLPMVETEDEEPEAPRAKGLDSGKETILLAENDPEVRKMARMLLENSGYHVITATDGEKAIKLISEQAGKIDLAVIDVVMPKRSIKEVLDLYCRLEPDGRVLLITGYSSEAMDVGKSGLDRVAFISKPFGPGLFLRSVRTLLDL